MNLESNVGMTGELVGLKSSMLDSYMLSIFNSMLVVA